MPDTFTDAQSSNSDTVGGITTTTTTYTRTYIWQNTIPQELRFLDYWTTDRINALTEFIPMRMSQDIYGIFTEVITDYV